MIFIIFLQWQSIYLKTDFLLQRTPLMEASCYGHLAVVQVLVDYRADLNAKDDRGVKFISLKTQSFAGVKNYKFF